MKSARTPETMKFAGLTIALGWGKAIRPAVMEATILHRKSLRRT
jgi:hypothetical protein